jgi:glyoxylase-like metal-dependent hydrolase (beta-lactamase superfamily II)
MLVVMLFTAGSASAQQSQGRQDQNPLKTDVAYQPLEPLCSKLPPGGTCLRLDNGNIQLLHVQGNVYMITGAGANITLETGDETTLMVDTGLPEKSDLVIAAIRALTDKPLFYIVATSIDHDHTGGNGKLSQWGWALPNSANVPFGHDVSDFTGLTLPSGSSIIGHINLLNRMSAPTGQKAPTPENTWPTDTYDSDDWRLYNGESFYVYHVPAAHTDGDSIVLFRGSDVVSTGDLFMPLWSYPVIDLDKGGSIDGYIAGLNQVVEMLVAKKDEEAGTYVVPGHGPICDRYEFVNYRDMVTILRARIAAMVEDGMTLEQVKASKPTSDYDGLGHYGATSDMFVEAVYRDLSSKMKNQKHKNAAGAGAR